MQHHQHIHIERMQTLIKILSTHSSAHGTSRVIRDSPWPSRTRSDVMESSMNHQPGVRRVNLRLLIPASIRARSFHGGKRKENISPTPQVSECDFEVVMIQSSGMPVLIVARYRYCILICALGAFYSAIDAVRRTQLCLSS